MTAVLGRFVHWINTDTLILSFEVHTVNLDLVKLVILVRMKLFVEIKCIWNHFPLGASASVAGLFRFCYEIVISPACIDLAVPDVASWVVPHSEGPRFPGPLLIRTRCPDTSSNSTL